MQETTTQSISSAGKSVDKKQQDAPGQILVDDKCTVSNNVGKAVEAVEEEGRAAAAAGGSTTLRMYDQIATESPLVDEKVKTKNYYSILIYIYYIYIYIYILYMYIYTLFNIIIHLVCNYSKIHTLIFFYIKR